MDGQSEIMFQQTPHFASRQHFVPMGRVPGALRQQERLSSHVMMGLVVEAVEAAVGVEAVVVVDSLVRNLYALLIVMPSLTLNPKKFMSGAFCSGLCFLCRALNKTREKSAETIPLYCKALLSPVSKQGKGIFSAVKKKFIH